MPRKAEASQVVLKAPGRDGALFLMQFHEKWDQYAPLGGKLEPGESPLAAAGRELEEELGGVRVGWDVAVEPLLNAPINVRRVSKRMQEDTEYTFHVFQAFFIRPVSDFSYLWALEKNRWFTEKEVTLSEEMRAIAERLDGGLSSIPSTWASFLFSRYRSAFHEALQACSVRANTATLTFRNVATGHIAGLGAAMRRRLLTRQSSEADLLLVKKVSLSKNGEGLTIKATFEETADTLDGEMAQAVFSAAWSGLQTPSPEEVIER